MITANPSQVMPKPPRLLDLDKGYDWREFDRWMQRLYLLLGTGEQGTAYNVINAHTDNTNEIGGLFSELSLSGPGLDQSSQATDALAALYMLSGNPASAVTTNDTPDTQLLIHTISKYNEPSGDEGCLHWM